jgi:hypothetical protein
MGDGRDGSEGREGDGDGNGPRELKRASGEVGEGCAGGSGGGGNEGVEEKADRESMLKEFLEDAGVSTLEQLVANKRRFAVAFDDGGDQRYYIGTVIKYTPTKDTLHLRFRDNDGIHQYGMREVLESWDKGEFYSIHQEEALASTGDDRGVHVGAKSKVSTARKQAFWDGVGVGGMRELVGTKRSFGVAFKEEGGVTLYAGIIATATGGQGNGRLTMEFEDGQQQTFGMAELARLWERDQFLPDWPVRKPRRQ